MIIYLILREVRGLAKLHMEAAQGAQKHYYDRTSFPLSQFKIGNNVIMREMRIGLSKFHLHWDGPYTIIILYSLSMSRFGARIV